MTDTTDAGTKSRTGNDEPSDEKNAEYWRLAGNQRDVLRVLDREGPSIGTAVHETLAKANPEAAKTSVYRALNAVAEQGFAAKTEVDDRANEYELTERGRAALEARYCWERGDCDGPDVVADGGQEIVPVYVVMYDEDADLDIDYDGGADGEALVTNHDEAEKYDVVRGMARETAEEHDLDILTPDRPMWREAYADIKQGEEFRLDEDADDTEGSA